MVGARPPPHPPCLYPPFSSNGGHWLPTPQRTALGRVGPVSPEASVPGPREQPVPRRSRLRSGLLVGPDPSSFPRPQLCTARAIILPLPCRLPSCPCSWESSGLRHFPRFSSVDPDPRPKVIPVLFRTIPGVQVFLSGRQPSALTEPGSALGELCSFSPGPLSSPPMGVTP